MNWHGIFKRDYQIAHLLSDLLNNTNVMGNLLYTIAVILVIIWALGFFGFGGFGMGGLIHALLVIAIIAVLFRLISGRGV